MLEKNPPEEVGVEVEIELGEVDTEVDVGGGGFVLSELDLFGLLKVILLVRGVGGGAIGLGGTGLE